MRTSLERKADLIDMRLNNDILDLEYLLEEIKDQNTRDRLTEVAGTLRRARASIRPFMNEEDRKRTA